MQKLVLVTTITALLTLSACATKMAPGQASARLGIEADRLVADATSVTCSLKMPDNKDSDIVIVRNIIMSSSFESVEKAEARAEEKRKNPRIRACVVGFKPR
jgi:hypothetical protein